MPKDTTLKYLQIMNDIKKEASASPGGPELDKLLPRRGK